MRATVLMISFLLATSLYAAVASAADVAPVTKESGKLENISSTPVATQESVMKDCPMHQGKMEKECDHKNGEPCPYHQNEKHHDKSHDKCDPKHPG
jgi:hypothetical protein